MYDASSEQTKTISAATSADVPGRPIGVLRPTISRLVDEEVLINRGAAALTVMPDLPFSNASTRHCPFQTSQHDRMRVAAPGMAVNLLAAWPFDHQSYKIVSLLTALRSCQR